ncbi:sugar transferase [Acetivibrio clariflavus]|uniref:Glycosyl transferase possibly involved in lipopolysaccharide synthesis n=1 Tax=Acetivibrio clariflavus (strain DSM 19732 / NBRC 101661 / EBR45) TaxID=720554 RepID=G8LX36_ACECE|nr:sugar transferase [Acetivibrio clariflavus]AEV67688.1 glycosyl transferase possibly involved in lipopolysaccharide synthesis [Acetivibrio clariflavus DSM 19732]
MKRLLDIVISFLSLVILFPLFVVIAVLVMLTSPGGIFFRGVRVGQYGKPFKIYKFRSMVKDAEGNGKWNVGNNDERITPIGRFLRITKIDELPQLINVLKGDMSLVGPRPELQIYVDMYTEEEKKILDLKPGITDWASLANFDQYRIFTRAKDPDEAYLKYIRPLKLKLQLYYRYNNSMLIDLKIILWTIYKVIFRSKRLPKEIEAIVAEYREKVEVSE